MRKIIVNPEVCNGLPTIESTRISVQMVLDFLSTGNTIEDLPAEYPTLSRQDVMTCFAYSGIPPVRAMRGLVHGMDATIEREYEDRV